MSEEIVTFDIAVLAKEKGFNYMKSNCFGDNMAYNLDDPTAIPACRANVVIGYILAPTQSLLQRWLREQHNISIKVDDFITDSKIRYDYNVTPLGSQEDNPRGLFETYELALETALETALNLI